MAYWPAFSTANNRPALKSHQPILGAGLGPDQAAMMGIFSKVESTLRDIDDRLSCSGCPRTKASGLNIFHKLPEGDNFIRYIQRFENI